MDRGSSGVVELGGADYHSVGACLPRASFTFSGVDCRALSVVIVRCIRLLSFGRPYHVRRVLVGNSAARVIGVNLNGADAVCFQFWGYRRRFCLCLVLSVGHALPRCATVRPAVRSTSARRLAVYGLIPSAVSWCSDSGPSMSVVTYSAVDLISTDRCSLT